MGPIPILNVFRFLEDRAEMEVASSRGAVTVILSLESVESVARYHWCRLNPGYGGRYICARRPERHPTQILLHRLLMDEPPGLDVDHINQDPLDNRLSNLRVVSRQGNMRNRAAPRHNTSGHKGVHWHKATQKWVARGKDDDGREVYLGLFADKDEAARVANAWRALNYPTSPEARTR